MGGFFYHAAVIAFGLFVVWVGRWMFFHPEKTLRKIYADMMTPSRFSNVFFRIFATTWVVIGLWTACVQFVPQAAWDRYALAIGIVVGLLVIACTFALLRNKDLARLADNSNRR